MTPLEYLAAVIITLVTGCGVGVLAWMLHHKHFL